MGMKFGGPVSVRDASLNSTGRNAHARQKPNGDHAPKPQPEKEHPA